MLYIKAKMAYRKTVVKEFVYEWVIPNFRGHFLPLKPNRAKVLEKISMAGKKEIITENLLAARGLVSIQGMMQKTGRSYAWIRSRLLQLKIKPRYTHRRKKYFDLGVIDRVLEEV